MPLTVYINVHVTTHFKYHQHRYISMSTYARDLTYLFLSNN